ncbi:MAG: EF-hand domain-containing protein [Verrucomicrobiota bacterium]
MKSLLVFLSLVAMQGLACAQSNSSGPSSPIVVGKIIAVGDDEESVTILQAGTYERVIPISEKTNVAFVGMPKRAREFTIGYGAKASLKGGKAKYLKMTLPLEEVASLGADRTAMTEESIFASSDANNDKGIDYVEMSKFIYHSPKHGPDKFQNLDADGDGLLDDEEFPKLLAGVGWWKFSRKTAAEWFAEGDANKDGGIDVDEFGPTFDGGSHTATRFKRADKNKDGMLDQAETTAYVATLIHEKAGDE